MTQFLTPSESAELSRNGIDITDPALDFAAEAAEVERKLSAMLGEPVRFYRDCPSTNDIADQLASEGWTGVVVADHQSAGRGRMGRSWSSDTGKNLLFSVVLRPDIAVVDAPRQPLIWASLLAERLGVFVKWPNDLVDGEDRKVAGLLSSMRIQANSDRVKHIILGIGLNVNQEQFEALPDAVSLRTIHTESFARGIVLHGLLKVLRQAAPPTLGQDGLDLWRSRSRTLGRMVSVGDQQGVAEGIRSDGALIVGGTPVLTGDVALMDKLVEKLDGSKMRPEQPD